jgi:hypothetical protein
MLIPYLLLPLFLITILISTTVWVGNRRFDGKVKTRVMEMASAAGSENSQIFSPHELADVPEPVRRYLEKSIPAGHPLILTTRVSHIGRFRMREETDKWHEMAATEYFTGHPPGFVWDAHIAMAPLVSVRVVDTYMKGTGSLTARILGLITIAESAGDPELDEGALMRYLAESVWFPTTLLPSDFLTWTPGDDQSATASLTDGENEVRLTFSFNDLDEIVSATAQRYRQEGNDYTLRDWTVSYDNYATRDGLRIPLSGKVTWHLPEGEHAYWEGRIVDIEFNPVEGPFALQR